MVELPSPVLILELISRKVTFTMALSLGWSPFYPPPFSQKFWLQDAQKNYMHVCELIKSKFNE